MLESTLQLQSKNDERYYEIKMEIKDIRSIPAIEIHTTIESQGGLGVCTLPALS
ncbi:hypothetical protein [Endozoicomonas euniceicola]|uniref:Uncharacterized protein n=1 Tax=Endozoicomonas euniceicola TaxID=1234143 RepID=A0ABY6GXU5_9GAMM|nr:hypothetical protein [Endozoicomonas euniceicola]UYM17600.1 hypothetical protein NX720_06760 [Endozoicomonas euniceicola]